MVADFVSLTLSGVALQRGRRLLFEGMNERFAAGEIVELVGPNGVGKTSLLRALSGLLPLTAGALAYDGRSGPLEEPQLALHLLGHRDGLKSPLTPREHLTFWSGLLGGGGAIDAALAQVGLAAFADMPGRVLSQGQGRRLALARLIVCPRPVWLLDEPAAALDTAGKALLRGLLRAHADAGGLVIAAAHEPLGVADRALALGGERVAA